MHGLHSSNPQDANTNCCKGTKVRMLSGLPPHSAIISAGGEEGALQLWGTLKARWQEHGRLLSRTGRDARGASGTAGEHVHMAPAHLAYSQENADWLTQVTTGQPQPVPQFSTRHGSRFTAWLSVGKGSHADTRTAAQTLHSTKPCGQHTATE